MPVDSLVDAEVDEVDNKTLAVQLRAEGLTLEQVGIKLGITKQGVSKLLKTSSAKNLPAARMEAASRTLAELAEATRQSAAEVFQMGVDRAKRRLREVGDSGDDHAAKVILETAKLSTDGARIVHGWADTNSASAGGRIAIGVITDLRGLKSAQVVDVTPVADAGEAEDDSNGHQKSSEMAENTKKPE